MSHAIVTILIGLPGSGKTTFLSENVGDGLGFPFDDFHRGSLDGTGKFSSSKHYQALCRRLRDGQKCVVSDIEYCRSARLEDAENGLREAAAKLGIDIEIKRLYFANDPDACRHNVIHRFGHGARRDYIAELKKIDELSATYECPSTGCIPVQACCSSRSSDQRD